MQLHKGISAIPLGGLIPMNRNDNFNLEAELVEPFPRKINGRVYLRVRSFRTVSRANKAAKVIRSSGGLVRIIHYTSYGSNAYRVYANANGKKSAHRAIDNVARLGKKWSDW